MLPGRFLPRERIGLLPKKNGIQCYRRYNIFICTYHLALQWLRGVRHPNGKLARWILKLEQYDYEIVHGPGNQMQHVDALSRASVREIKFSGWSTSSSNVMIF